jgi:hypothetical protein
MEITLRQAEKLVSFFGGHDTEMTVIEKRPEWQNEPDGLYAYVTEYPEDGTTFLGATDVDDDLADKGRTHRETALAVGAVPFQQRVEPWMQKCFGPEIAADAQERNHRFLEESLELVQACGCTQSEAHQLVDYVFGRAVDDKKQEVGGVMVTLAALCLAQGLDMDEAGDVELRRVWDKIDQIRAKQAAKPKHSPLPEAPKPDHLKLMADAFHNNVVAMQAAVIEWQHGQGPEAAMAWIVNTLEGPGLLPKPEEPYSTEAQAYFDKHRADPFPECFCGRPSNIYWKGQGFCCDAHHAEAKLRAVNEPAGDTEARGVA